MLQAFAHESGLTGPLWRKSKPESWPLPNVWLGVSCEDQAAADKRIPLLLETPAAVRFVSAEPLLGPIDFGRIGNALFDREAAIRKAMNGPASPNYHQADANTAYPELDWGIVGGESGHGARPCNVEWIRSIVRQFEAAGVPVFMKQLGSVVVTQHPMGARGDLLRVSTADRKGGDPSEWTEDLRVREFPG